MDKKEILEIAKQYLSDNRIDYAEPITFGRLDEDVQEVVFTDPLTLDPGLAVVDPPVITILVNVKTREATLMHEM